MERRGKTTTADLTTVQNYLISFHEMNATMHIHTRICKYPMEGPKAHRHTHVRGQKNCNAIINRN